MSKIFISRLSIILLSSLMVIQSCQTPNNVNGVINNDTSNKLTFSTKYLSDIDNIPVFQNVSGGASSDRSGILSASTTFNDTRLNSADSKRFYLKFLRSNTSLYTEKIVGADLAFSFSYSELKPAESEVNFRKFEHKMSIDVHLDVDNSINTRGVHLKGTVPVSNISQPQIGSIQPQIGNFISGNYQDLFGCYWGAEDFHAIYTEPDGVKVSVVDGKVTVNIPSVIQSFTGQYNTTNCGGTNGYVFLGGNLTSGNISFTVDAIVNPDPTLTPTPYPTGTPTIFPTPNPTPTPAQNDCNAYPTGMNNGVNISNNLVNNLNPKFSIKNISTDILNNNIQLRNSLRNELNSLYNDNLFSIEKSFNYTSLTEYTNKLKSLDLDLDFYLNDDENIIEALDVIADKSQIYSEVATSSLNFNESEKSKFLTSLLSSITSDAKTINSYYQKQLSEDISIRTELAQELPEVQEDFQKLIVLSLIKQGILNPYTLEINSNNSFKTKAISSDISSLFNTAWTNIKSQYNTASNFILQLETPVLDQAAGLIFDNWDQIKASDPDGAKKILENLRDASIIAPSGPEDLLPCGKGIKAAKSVGSHISKPISDLILKELGDVLKRNPDLGKKIKDMYKKVLGLKPSGSSTKLGGNIFNAPFNHPQKGKPKPTGWQSHHIVEESKDNLSSQKSRELLENNGINYKTDAYNGVNLPTRSAADKSPDFPKVINHKETFNPNYAEAVNNRLEKVIENLSTPEQKKVALQNELLSITNDLLNGKKFWSSK